MKKIFLSFLLLAVTLSSSYLYAQAPGFLGKRFFVEGHLGINAPILKMIEPYSESKITPIFPRLSLNYVLTRNKYLALKAERYVYEDDFFLSSYSGDIRYRLINNVYTLGRFRTKARKNYGGTIAPLGYFTGLEISYNRISSEPMAFAETGDLFTDADLAAYDEQLFNPNVSYLAVLFTFGTRKIIKDKITFAGDINLGIPFAVLNHDIHDATNLSPAFNGLTGFEDFVGLTINISLAVGVLLF